MTELSKLRGRNLVTRKATYVKKHAQTDTGGVYRFSLAFGHSVSHYCGHAIKTPAGAV